MPNEKLFSILRLLSPLQFKRLHRATLSTFHQGSPTAQKTYKALSSYYPDFELSPKDIRKIHTKLFPKKDFNLRSVERCTNALLKTTESFLLYLQLEDDEYLQEKMISRALIHPDVFDLFEKSQSNQHKILDKRKQKEEDYWQEKTELYDSLYAHKGHEKYDADDDTHTKLNETSDRFYINYKIHNSIILQKNTPESDLKEEDILLKEIHAAKHRED